MTLMRNRENPLTMNASVAEYARLIPSSGERGISMRTTIRCLGNPSAVNPAICSQRGWISAKSSGQMMWMMSFSLCSAALRRNSGVIARTTATTPSAPSILPAQESFVSAESAIPIR